jgi:hypothetical protein
VNPETKDVVATGNVTAGSIIATGNVGIGTFNPLQKLDVNGSIAISGFKSLRFCIGYARFNSATIYSTVTEFNVWKDSFSTTYTKKSSNSYIEIEGLVDGSIFFTSGYGDIGSRLKCTNNNNATIAFSNNSVAWCRSDGGYFESTAKLASLMNLGSAFCPANSIITIMVQYNVNILVGTSKGGGINIWTSGPSYITINEFIE